MCWCQPISVRVKTMFDPCCSRFSAHGCIYEQPWIRGSTFHHCLSHPLTSFRCHYSGHKMAECAVSVTPSKILAACTTPVYLSPPFHTVFIAISRGCLCANKRYSKFPVDGSVVLHGNPQIKRKRRLWASETGNVKRVIAKWTSRQCRISSNIFSMMVFWFNTAVPTVL